MADASSAKAMRRLPATPVTLSSESLQWQNMKAKKRERVRDPRESWFLPCVDLQRERD